MLKKLTCFLPNGTEVNFSNAQLLDYVSNVQLLGYVSASDIEVKKGIAIVYLMLNGKKTKAYYNCPFIFEEEL